MRKEDVVVSLFSVITANGLCYNNLFLHCDVNKCDLNKVFIRF